MSDILKWGIVGPGKIAQKFADDLKLVNGNEIFAVGSRSLDRAKSFVVSNKASKYYSSYDELFADRDVDIVYIATPHHLHAELSIQAMKAGKHVLCEKPASLSLDELSKVVKASKDYDVFYMEALWSRFNHSIQKALALIRNNEIGQVKYINADFCFPATINPEGRLFNIKLAGGSLLDIGIYPVFLSYLILGLPSSINASANFHASGVDQQCAIMFKYEDAHSMLYSSFDVKSKMEARIYGEHGYILLHDRWHEAAGLSLIKNGVEQDFSYPLLGNGFTGEIAECKRCINLAINESELWSHADSKQLMTLLEEIMNLTGISYT